MPRQVTHLTPCRILLCTVSIGSQMHHASTLFMNSYSLINSVTQSISREDGYSETANADRISAVCFWSAVWDSSAFLHHTAVSCARQGELQKIFTLLLFLEKFILSPPHKLLHCCCQRKVVLGEASYFLQGES